jgi:hypothetical protein
MADQLKKQLLSWTKYNCEIELHMNELKKLRQNRSLVETAITTTMIQKKMTNTNINMGDFVVKYHEKKDQTTLSFKFLEKCAFEFFQKNEQMTKQFITFIKSHRVTSSTPTLKMSKK